MICHSLNYYLSGGKRNRALLIQIYLIVRTKFYHVVYMKCFFKELYVIFIYLKFLIQKMTSFFCINLKKSCSRSLNFFVLDLFLTRKNLTK